MTVYKIFIKENANSIDNKQYTVNVVKKENTCFKNITNKEREGRKVANFIKLFTTQYTPLSFTYNYNNNNLL